MLLKQESKSEGDLSYPLLNTYYYPLHRILTVIGTPVEHTNFDFDWSPHENHRSLEILLGNSSVTLKAWH